jgi:multiple sugar transport system substrate-binding protein
MPSTGVDLTLLAWDDPRATAPLRAAVAAYGEIEPGARIELVTRPLSAFNDEPIEEATTRADLVVFDHPMVPRAVEVGALRPLDDLLQAAPDGGASYCDAVGLSAASYRWSGRTWGLAIDAACQVTAARPDLVADLGSQVPTTFDELVAFADDHPGRVAVPLYPSDAICTLLTLSVAHARAAGEPDTWLRRDAVDALCALVARSDPRGFDRNPPALLAGLGEHDAWAVVPFTFGYANVARTTGPRPVRWYDLPTVGGVRTSILGGAGLGVSAATRAPAAAGRFALWVASPEVQRTIAVPNGGQPASRAVWDDPVADDLAGGFFRGTRRTMDAAFIRPLRPWWPDFQHRAGRALTSRLAQGDTPTRIHDELRALHDSYDDGRSPMGSDQDGETR